MAAFPQTVQELRDFILAIQDEAAAGHAVTPMPQQEIAEAREAVARAGAAIDLITNQQAVMRKSEEVTQARLQELSDLVETQIESLKDRMQEEVDKTSAELERQDEATEAAITTAQRCMMEAQATTQASASERLTKELMDQQLNVREMLRATKEEARK